MDMGMAELADTKHDLLRPSVSIKESSGFISGAVVRLVLDSQARPARGPSGPGTDTAPGTEAFARHGKTKTGTRTKTTRQE